MSTNAVSYGRDGGDAMVSFDVPDQPDHEPTDLDLYLEQRMLTYIALIGRAETTTLEAFIQYRSCLAKCKMR